MIQEGAFGELRMFSLVGSFLDNCDGSYILDGFLSDYNSFIAPGQLSLASLRRLPS
jgi:hypothetical protein